MLTTSQSAAIHCALILGLPEPEAAKCAGIPLNEAQTAISQIDHVIRGRKIDFNRWLSGGDPVQADQRLLFYEIQLGRLEYQHDECVSSWRRTKEHADKLHEKCSEPLDAHGKPIKPFVGDIRFLQLAKNIRREMEKIEKLIVDRLEELQGATATANKTLAEAKPQEPPSTASEAVDPASQAVQPPAASTTDAPANVKKDLPPAPPPVQNSDLAREKREKREKAAIEFLTALQRENKHKPSSPPKPIPIIEPPERQRGIYAAAGG